MNTLHLPEDKKLETSTPHYNPFRLQRILLVEDDLEVCELNAEVLREAGYRVATAQDGAAAWDAIQISNYDLVITDQFLPRISGVELAQIIYKAHLDLPVIMTTASLPTWEFILHPCLNSITMLQKPYTTAKLLSLVESVLNLALFGQEKLASVVCLPPSKPPIAKAVRPPLWQSLN